MISRKVALTAACLALSSVAAVAQQNSGLFASTLSATTTSPVAYIYVSRAESNASVVNGYAAAANGTLTPIAGSPFKANVQFMALNGKYLFGEQNIVDILTFSIAANGALHQVASIDAQGFNNPNNDGGPVSLFLDHTGATLYDGDILADGANNGYQFFDINKNTGKLTFAGLSDLTVEYDQRLRFIGNNLFAYGADLYHFSPDIFGFERKADGTLVDLHIDPQIPTCNIAGSAYMPFLAAADPANHVAISLTPGEPFNFTGPTQLAVYQADSAGNLTTSSTAENMPTTAAGFPNDISMAPSGELLAVGGGAGLEVFHFNGDSPITHYTGLLTSAPVTQIFWDNNNHLYAVSPGDNKLFVFTVTPTAFSQAPGSPYAISKPQNIVVLPK